MSLNRMARQRLSLHQQLDDERGTTLIELVVGMVIMTIFLGIFTTAIVSMYGAVNKSQAITSSNAQLNVAFSNLDKTVRYAAFISNPGTGTSGDWYVELRVTYTGAEVCNQLRVDLATNQLQRRTWTVSNGTAGTLSVWVPIASGIANGGAAAGATTQPFYVVPPGPNTVYQQLRMNLVAPATFGGSVSTSTSTFTFTALNSTLPAPTTSICQQQGRP